MSYINKTLLQRKQDFATHKQELYNVIHKHDSPIQTMSYINKTPLPAGAQSTFITTGLRSFTIGLLSVTIGLVSAEEDICERFLKVFCC